MSAQEAFDPNTPISDYAAGLISYVYELGERPVETYEEWKQRRGITEEDERAYVERRKARQAE